MRLFVSELLKLFSKRIFTVCIVISLLANGFFLVFAQESQNDRRTVHDLQNEYTQLLDSCLQSDDPQKILDSKDKEIEIGFFLANSSSDTNSDIYDEERVNHYKQNYPNEYSNAVNANLSREELQKEKELVVNITSQLEYIDGYDEFIDEMESRANEQLKFSIFAKPGTFAYNNIKKTPSDFQQLKNNKLIIGNNNCVKAATTFSMTDYLVAVLIVLLCIFLFTVEREKGLYPLVRSTQNGRVPTAFSKIAVICVISFFMTIVFYTENILTSGYYFGFGDLTRSIQSIDIFMNCSLKLSILQYLVLWIIGKITFFVSFGLLLSFIFTVIKNSSVIYAVIAVILSFEFFCYMFIQGTSSLNTLKFVNIVYLMNGNNIFGNYQNVNIFEIPVNIITVHIIMCAVFVTVGIIGTCAGFAKSNQFAKKSRILSNISEIFAKKKKIRGNTLIFSGEAFKHYKTSFCAVILIALAVFGYSNLTKDLNIVFFDSAESNYNLYMQTLEGVMTPEKYDFIESEQNYFDDIRNQISQISMDNTLNESQKNSEIVSLQSIIDNKGRGFEEICNQLEYAKSKSEEINKPVELVNELTTKRLLLDTFRDWCYFTLILAVIVFCTSNIFACEYKRNMVNLLRSNKSGKSKLLLIKLFTVLLTSVIAFILIYLPYMINFINTFGTNSFNISLAFSRDFSQLNSSITVIKCVLLMGLLHFVIAITATIFIYMLSFILKNNFMTMIVSSGLILIPCIVVMSNSNIRIISMFTNGDWVFLTIILLCVCAIIITASLIVTFKKFNNTVWRKKYVNA